MKLRDLVALAHVKVTVRDIAVAMVDENLRYIDLTVGGGPGDTSLSLRIFLVKGTLPDGTEVIVGKRK